MASSVHFTIRVIWIELHSHGHESDEAIEPREQNEVELHSLSRMCCRQDAHCVEVRLHQLAKVCRLADGTRKPGQTVSKLHIVSILGLRRIGGLSLHDVVHIDSG